MSKKSKSQSTEVQSSASEDHTHSAPADHALMKAKGDVLDRFWASVEPYCADITETEINMLEEGMKSVSAISLSLSCSFHLSLSL